MINIYKIKFILAIFIFIGTSLYSKNERDKELIVLDDHVQLIDVSSFIKIKTAAFQKQDDFISYNQFPSMYLANGHITFQFSILSKKKHQKSLLLLVEKSFATSDFKLFIKHPTGKIDTIQNPLNFNYSNLPNFFLIDIPIFGYSHVEYYLQIENYGQNIKDINFYISRNKMPSEFWADQWLSMSLLYMYFGMVVVMFFYNLFLFFIIRDPTYLYYILMLLTFNIVNFLLEGIQCQNIYQIHPFANLWILNKAFPLFMFMMFGFIRSFLLLKKYNKWLNRFYFWSQVISAVIFILWFIPLPFVSLKIQITNILILVSIPFSFYSGFYTLKKGHRPAKYFLIAWLALLLAGAMAILKSLGIYEFHFDENHLLLVGSAIEFTLLSLALGERINQENKEKNIAQRKQIDTLQENKRIVAEQNELLESEINKRTKELTESNDKLSKTLKELKTQKDTIFSKTIKIQDSIEYARKIQMAILPSNEYFQQLFPTHFIHYVPKDIVSGDFYWVSKSQNFTFLAVVDCTGHGVPGAFMSVVGYNLLNQIVNEQKVTDTIEILEKLDQNIRQLLHQDENSGQLDGMDIALVRIDQDNKEIHFCGAGRPLYYIIDDDFYEIKGARHGVGGSSEIHSKTFDDNIIKYTDHIRIFAFTDGITDQFGCKAKMQKKYSSKRLKEKIQETKSKTVQESGKEIIIDLQDWQYTEEQLDDILFIVFEI